MIPFKRGRCYSMLRSNVAGAACRTQANGHSAGRRNCPWTPAKCRTKL